MAFLLAGGTVTLSAGTIVYEDTSSSQFGTINLSSGVFSQIGSLSQVNTGLGVSGNGLYTGAFNTGNLFEIDPGTGALTMIGSSSINYLDTGSTTSGLYAIGGANSAGAALSLFSINPTTGASTLIGALGLSISTTVADSFGLSTGSGALYFSFGPSFSSDTLYTLDTTTGSATAVGAIGLEAVSASVLSGGTLWGSSNYNGTTTTPRCRGGNALRSPILGAEGFPRTRLRAGARLF